MLKNYFDEDKFEEIKNTDNLIYKALEIVTTLFENDTDKGIDNFKIMKSLTQGI